MRGIIARAKAGFRATLIRDDPDLFEHMRLGRPARVGMRWGAELVVTAALVVAAFAFYLLVWTDHRAGASQSELVEDFHDQVHSADTKNAGTKVITAAHGEAVCVMRIRALGEDWRWVVVEGETASDLAEGPGHVPGTAMPGEPGNVVVVGHRSTAGAPFARLGRLEAGDDVVVQTINGWYVYRVAWRRTVPADEIDATTRDTGAGAASRTMTLVTSASFRGSAARIAVGTTLVGHRSIAAGPPAAVGR